MILVGKRRVQVAEDLAEVTRIDHAAECDPVAVEMSSAGVNKIWQSVEHLYRAGIHPALTLVLRRRGQIVLKRSIGCVRGNAPGHAGPLHVLEPDAPQCLFSASKSITALLVFKLIEQGKLSLDDEVTQYLPEFGQGGKGHITLLDLMTHRAGVPYIPKEQRDPELLRDFDRVVQLICASPSQDQGKRRQAYHALTAGFIIGEIIKRVADRELNELLSDWLAKPLGCQYLSYGIAPEHREQVPLNIVTGQRLFWPVSEWMERLTAVPFEDAVAASNEDAFMSSVVPAGNIYAAADDLCKIFEMLLNGGSWQGEQVLSETSVHMATRPMGKRRLDRTILLPMRYSPAFMLGEDPIGVYGPGSGDAFGHIGFLNLLGWADPRRDISATFLNTGKSLALAGIARHFGVLRSINNACEPITA
ncbi:MAG: serine hydrolase domain-containing protein [Nevskiales bacterium]